MEYCAGGEFFDLVVSGDLDAARHREYFRQLVSGILHMHAIGIVHLDIRLDFLIF